MASTETTAKTDTGGGGGDKSAPHEVPPVEPGPCQVCQAPSKFRCSACHSVYYCSPEHQKQDWKNHKKDGGCSPSLLVLVQDDRHGRYWVAARNIKAGELILKELPVTFSPLPAGDGNVCMSCCKQLLPPGTQFPPEPQEIHDLEPEYARKLTTAVMKPCRKCGWPVCGEDCEKNPIHADNECQLFASRSIKFPVSPSPLRVGNYILDLHADTGYTLQGISLIRGLLLKRKNPRIWKKIMKLQVGTKRTEFVESSDMKEVSNQIPFAKALGLRNDFKADDLESPIDWGKLEYIMETNQQALHCGEVGNLMNRRMQGLYLQVSLFNHSCMPNAYRNICSSPAFEVQVRAATDIKKGEMITLNYHFGESLLHGTETRIKPFNCGFLCQCARCLDPTELGTYLSAILCDRCPEKGIMLLTTFQNSQEPYRCQTPGCKNTKTRSSVADLISAYHQEICEENSDILIRDAAKLEKFITRLSGKTLHPNHWLLVDSERGCFMAYKETYETNPEHLARFLKYGKRRVELMATTSPGLSIDLVWTQLEVIKAMKVDIARQESKLSREETYDRWVEVYKWASNSFKYWLTDLEDKPLPPESDLPQLQEQMDQLMMEVIKKSSELFPRCY